MTVRALVKGLFSYPVKGLSAQRLDHVTLRPGEGFPGDRMFGFARADSGFDPSNPKPMPKHKFLVLAQEAALAELHTTFDPGRRLLEVTHNGQMHCFDLSQPEGQNAAAAFLSDHLNLAAGKMPSFVYADQHTFTDVSVVSEQMMHAVSILNLESLRALEAKSGLQINPARFRANLVFDGWPAFSELERIGEEISIGAVRLRLIYETRRCAATEVDPETAQRDQEIPRLLHQHYGHMNMGVYAEVLTGGEIKTGQKIMS